MKRYETTQAPKLLAALRKIHREGHVLQQFLAQLASSRRSQANHELKAGDHSKGEASVVLFAQYYRNLGKQFFKDVQFLETLLPDDQATSSSAFETAARDLVEKVTLATSDAVTDKLRHMSSNDELVKCYLSSSVEIGKVVADATSRVSALLGTLTTSLGRPFEGQIPLFVQREQQVIDTAVNAASSADDLALKSQVRHAVDQVVASLDRCAVFFPDSTLPQVLGHATEALVRLLQHVSVGGGSGPAPPATVAFRRFNSLCITWRSMSALCEAGTGWLVTSRPRFTNSDVVSQRMCDSLDRLRSAESTSRTACVKVVCDAMQGPFNSILKQYVASTLWSQGPLGSKGLAVYNPGQVAPSDLIRQLGAELMELPMSLDAVESSITDPSAASGEWEAPEWLSVIVSDVVDTFVATLRTITIHPRQMAGSEAASQEKSLIPPLEQLVCDMEYFGNVLAAVSEANYERSLGRAMVTLQAALELQRTQPSNAAVDIATLLESNA
jgi:hypothetical protein